MTGRSRHAIIRTLEVVSWRIDIHAIVIAKVIRACVFAMTAGAVMSAGACHDDEYQTKRAADVAAALTAPDTVELGSVLPRDAVPFRFTVRNTSSRPVKLGHIFSSCSCTRTTVAAIAFNPNDEVTIDGVLTVADSFVTGSSSSFVWIGPDRDHRLSVYVHADIPKQLPDVIRQAGSERITIPLHEQYRGRAQEVVVYPEDTDSALVGGLTPDAAAVEFSAPSIARSFEVVVMLDRTDGPTFRLVQTIKSSSEMFSGVGTPDEPTGAAESPET